MLKIQKWKDFNGNGCLQGVRHAAPYDDHFGLLWWPFWIKKGTKIPISCDLGKIWFPSRSWSCELIIVIVFGIGSHGVGWCLLLLCNGNSSSYSSLSLFFLWHMNLSTAVLRHYWTEFHETWWSYRYMFLVGPKVFSFVVKGVTVIFWGVQKRWGLL